MSITVSSPLVTTVIPTYRRPKLVARAIHSVLNQSYPHLQVCVYDNASGDDTAAVVAAIIKEDPRVKYYCHPQNIGAIANFNHGMKQIKTPFFTLLGDDNTVMPAFFEDAIRTLQSYPEADIFVGETIRVNEKGDKIGSALESWQEGLVSPPDGLLNTVEKGLPLFESILFRKTILNSVGVFNPYFGPQADFDFLMRIGKKHTMYVSMQPCAIFLHHDDRLTHSIDLQEKVTIHKKMFEQWLDSELSRNEKKRIRAAWKEFVERAISTNIYERCILGNDRKILAMAMEIMKQELGYSYKPLRNIIVARMTQQNKFLKTLLRKLASSYVKSKKKIRGL